jgi:hypothetical protein
VGQFEKKISRLAGWPRTLSARSRALLHVLPLLGFIRLARYAANGGGTSDVWNLEQINRSVEIEVLRVKTLTKIQIVLTVLVGVALIAGMKMASWLHSMAFTDPVRQQWQPRLDSIGSVIWFSTFIPWLLFTVFHLIVVLKRNSKHSN